MAPDDPFMLEGKTVLVTGAARRIGAEIARTLHGAGASLALHYRSSEADARALQDSLNGSRPDSAALFQADLLQADHCAALVQDANDWRGRLDVLVNNASSFYPTPLGSITEEQWHELAGSNLKAPLFLAQAAAPHLRDAGGSIVNIVDIHARRPLKNHLAYSAAKAGLVMLTRGLARELAPQVRVNGVAPGAIMWPEDDMTEAVQANILQQIPMGKSGKPEDVANCVLFLVRDATYTTGSIISVDGGRSAGWPD